MSNCEFCYFPIGILGQVWYLIVSIPDLCRLSYFVLASHQYCSTHCVDVVDIWERKRLNCKNYHFQELYFSKVSNVRSTSASFGKPHLSFILTKQCLTIMVRSGTVIDIVPLWWHCPCADPEGVRGSGHPLENNNYVHGFLKKLAFGPPPGKSLTSPPPWKIMDPSGSLVKYKYSFLSNKTIGPPL